MWRYLAAVATVCGLVLNNAQATTPDLTVSHINHDTLIDPIKNDNTARRQHRLCLALGLYHEARGSTTQDQLAVGNVILNRIKQSNGKTTCQIIWADGGSQFQWVRRPLRTLVPREDAAWRKAQQNALRLLSFSMPDPTNGATMFFNPKLCWPRWASRGTITARVGSHVFVKPKSKT